MKQKTQLKGAVMLLLTALIWGMAFTAQSKGMESVGAFTFNGIRMLMGAAVLLPCILIRDRIAGKKLSPQEKAQKKRTDRKSLKYGVLLGVIFCVASNIQQQAFAYTSAGKIAFITALYIFFVPLLGLFVKKRTPAVTWLCVLLGFAGLYFLCVDPKDIGEFNKGDLLAIGCAAVFALHILAIERFTAKADGLRLSAMQFLVGGVLSCAAMFIFEKPSISGISGAAIPLLYAGIMSCGVAYTLQIIGQKYTEATVASLLLCMESVFGVLTAAVILGERLNVREIIGCVIMFAAIILSQFSERLSRANKKTA
ncbi:DMT family transporter [Ruminococcus sp. FC2018]|uniref:DMT family transporter n=1 Tax=Ruminococcus sp. FC2018 TaxID=1410617 RepID=UPI00048F17FE|nr:DMT family transporter [Ruminococcus sp. FC2018]